MAKFSVRIRTHHLIVDARPDAARISAAIRTTRKGDAGRARPAA